MTLRRRRWRVQARIIAANLAASCQSLDNFRHGARLPHLFRITALLSVSPDAPEIEILRRGRWFAALPPALQSRIAQLAVPRRFRAGQYLLRAGDPPRGMFRLVQGRTRHVYPVGEDRGVLLHVGGPGLWTGEYVLISRGRSINSVIADAPTTALFLSAKDWHRIVDEEPRWLSHFAVLLAERFATPKRRHCRTTSGSTRGCGWWRRSSASIAPRHPGSNSPNHTSPAWSVCRARR
jgi:Cyclic nucleotide-binding domain